MAGRRRLPNWSIIDRLVAKGLVSQVESAEDRRMRIVALTPRGKNIIVKAFRKHAGQMKRVFSELCSAELRALEVALKQSVSALTRSCSRAEWFSLSSLRIAFALVGQQEPDIERL